MRGARRGAAAARPDEPQPRRPQRNFESRSGSVCVSCNKRVCTQRMQRKPMRDELCECVCLETSLHH